MELCACRDDIGYRCPLHKTNWQARATAAEAREAKLREALEELLHAYCSDTGFAAAVRRDTGLAYPWEPGEIAEAKARAALETDNG
jgi:hypothetical protein